MSLHKDLIALVLSLQQFVDDPRPGYQDARMDISDDLDAILDKHPLLTGHEWTTQTVFWPDAPDVPDHRSICKHCGMDRIFGDEGEMCDRLRPLTTEREE